MMEGKSMVKLSHMVAFLLLASLFQPLTARDVGYEKEVLRFPVAKENQVEADFCNGKNSWPELVGKPARTAKEIIEKENPAAKVVILLPGQPKIQNFVCGRVFLLVSWKFVVEQTPTMEVCCFPEPEAQRMG